MDIVMRPRQGGKTYEQVQLLIEERDAVMIVADHQRKQSIRPLVHTLLRDQARAVPRPRDVPAKRIVARDVDDVMKRVIVASQALYAKHPARVMVDGLESVLQALVGGVDTATMDMPYRAGLEYSVRFENEGLQELWEKQQEYQRERRARWLNAGVLYGAGPKNTNDPDRWREIARDVVRGDRRRFDVFKDEQP